LRQRVTELEALKTEHERVLDVLQKRNRDLALLNRAGQTLAATLDLQEVVSRMLRAVTETIGAQASSVWLWDKDAPGWLVCQAAFDSGEDYPLVNVRLSPGQGIAGWVAQNAKSVIATRTDADPRFSADVDAEIGFQTASLLAVPLLLQNEVLGVLEVVNKLTGEFDEDDQAVVETLAASAAIALDNARLVDELRMQTKELEIRNEDLDAFAQTVAHDLKSPAGIIIGFAEALDENIAAIQSEDLRRHLRTIARNGRKMNSIIKELLLLASVRRAQVETQCVDMGSVVGEATERLDYLLDESGAEVVEPDHWPASFGYAPWIEEVWVNYISNAVKYGGRPPRVELGATELPDGVVRFWAQDNGPGLTVEDQSRLFRPFTQLQPARAEGSGLGLSIVQRIVEKLGGQVGVESQLGQGSIFYFTLPGRL
jgi:signal transduction histidine kinase